MFEWLRGLDVEGLASQLFFWLVAALCLCTLAEGLLRKGPKKEPFAFLQALSVKKEVALVLGISLLAGFLRFFYLGSYPMGINNDEASTIYDALCMADYGTDRYGYQNPVYLQAWGSGQSVLYMYLLVPLFKLFGYSLFWARFPQALLGTLLVPCLYLVLRRLAGRLVAAIGAVLAAISPWFIMSSRWGQEIYPLMFFLMAGLAFFLYAERWPALYLPAFFTWGLSLYCYITNLLFLPLFLGMVVLYWWWNKKIAWKWFWVGVGLFALMALPLGLFLLVNNGLLPEIRTAFISIPKMLQWRQGEVGGAQSVYQNAAQLLDILVWQRTALPYNYYHTLPGFEVVYTFSLPFMAGGAFGLLRRFWRSLKARVFLAESVWVFWLAAALVQGLLVWPNTYNRCMQLGMVQVVLAAYGVRAVLRRLRSARVVVPVAYLLGFSLFFSGYFFSLAPQVGRRFNDSLPEALAYADQVAQGRDVLVPGTLGLFTARDNYTYVLLNRRPSPDAFMAGFNTNPKEEYPGAYNFENVYFLADDYSGPGQYGTEKIYIINNQVTPVQAFIDAGYEVYSLRNYSVAYWPQ